ncbi:MAG: FlgD immunoglobulin-like domain containing protein [candidate division WOR-3 bacterium]
MENYFYDSVRPLWQDGPPYECQHGDSVEGAVMQVLWDLYDDSNTNDDSPGKDDEGCDSWVDKIWATISRQRSNNIAEFRQLWNGSNFPNYTEMNNCNLYGTKPPAPSNLLASDITHNSVRLNWNDNAQNEGQYLIYRYREGSPNWEVIVRPPNTSSYTDATLDPVTGYNYKVRALTCDSSNFSNEIYIKTKYLPVTNLQARHLQDRVELSWNNPEPGFVGTLIVRKEGSPIGWNPTDGQGYNIGEVVAPGVIVIYNGNGEQFVDNLSNPNPCYYYKAFAYTAHNGVSLFSLGVEACATLPFSEFVPITGYNNAPKVISRGRNIYLTYFSGTDEFQGRYRVIYQYSSDGGNTWQSEYAADFANNCLSPISPAISLDGQGNPYIVWVNWWRQDKGPPQPALEWRLGYTRKIENNWENVRWLMIEGVGQNVPVPQEHFPVSFVVARESGYVAVKYDYENRKEIRTIAFSLGGNNCWNCILPQSANFSSDPSINIDAGGRISVVFTKGSDRRIYIYFKNDRYNDNWNIQQTNFYGYHPTSFINGDTLLISWYNESDNWIKLARFLKSQNGYTLLAIENVTQPDWFLTYPSPKIIRGDLILCENSYNNGISYSLKRGNAWNTVIIDNSGSTNFLYPQACIVPVIRNGKMLLNQGLQVFWTLKENEIYYLRNRLAILPISPNYANYSKITFSNQGELLTIEPGTENSHMVYDAGGRIVYAKSLDKGESWESVLEVDSGSYPSLCLDNSGMPRISYLKNDTVFCKTLKSDNTWHKTILFGGNGNLKPNQAVIAQTYPKDLSRYSYCAFLVKNLSEGNSKLYLSIFNVEEDIGPEPEEVADGISLKSPSIAITPGDIIHLVWEEGGEIYYRFGEKDSTGELIWSEIYNISESPEVISENPVIEAYGELVIACWKEGEPGEIYRRVRNLAEPPLPTWPPGWSGIENLSQSPDKESNYPVISTPDVCAGNEKVDSLNYEVIAWVKGSLVNLSESENSSKYPHISVEPPTISDDGTVSPDVIINAIWTEEIIPDTLYEVRFKRYTYTSSSIAKTPYLAPVIGETIPSTYCESRDGVINYGDFSCDYSSSSLIYNLPYLNPRASYLLRAVVYKETPRVWREEVYVDSQFITEVFYYPYIPETLNIILPKESYENDLAIKKEIERLIGSYALIADLKVYEVSLPESLQGGGQSLRGGKILRPVLSQNRPNPFKGLTKISFSIPKETYVSLLIYDLSGRKVRTIVNERMKPGYYNLKWDGKDDKGKDLPQGVYFYRLKVKGFEDIKKTVLLR